MIEHTLTKTDDGWHCSRCQWQWLNQPNSDCPGMPRFDWWANSNHSLHRQPPENIKTKRQLKEMKLKPGKAVGCIAYKGDWLWLYDPNEATPTKATSAQLAALAKGRESQAKARKEAWEAELKCWEEELIIENEALEKMIYNDQMKASQWANKLLERDDWVILDTETTGLYNAEICQIAIIDHVGETLLDTLVKPSIPIPSNVTKIHGITDEMVQNAPTFPEVYPLITKVIADKVVVIYNKAFDTEILDYCCNLHQLPSLWIRNDYRITNARCAMLWYARWVGQYNEYHQDYTWQPLGGDHTSLGDCRRVLELLKAMANNSDS